MMAPEAMYIRHLMSFATTESYENKKFKNSQLSMKLSHGSQQNTVSRS